MLDMKATYVDPDSGASLRRLGESLVSEFSCFPLTNDIARFVPSAGIASNWSRQWARWSGLHVSSPADAAEKFKQKFGLDPRDPSLLPMKVLDAGCGSGRNLLAFLNTKHWVWGVDLSDSVEVVRRTIKGENIEICQADLTKLPFPNGFFDLVFCDGVLIHLPDIQSAISCLSQKLKTGGQIFLAMAKEIPVDRRDLVRREKIINFYRYFTTRISNQQAIMKIVDALSGLYYHRNRRLLGRLVWYLCPELHDDEEWRKCYIHDYLTAKIRLRQNPDRIVNILNGLGFKDITVLPSHEVRVVAVKRRCN